MTFVMTYDKRNRDNLNKLADNTKVKALEWYQFCIDNKIDILIYETIRTKQTQAQYVDKGVSKTMKSYHLVGQALDFVPIINGKTMWGQSAYAKKPFITAIEYAEKLGFESGYRWGWDAPHLQFNFKGYGTDTFGKKPTVTPQPPPPPNQEVLMWGKTIFKKGQIGKITINEPINLWKDGKDGKLEMVRILLPQEEYRVYGYRNEYGGQYDVGGGCWITKIPTKIKYETPSKSLLAKAKEFYK